MSNKRRGGLGRGLGALIPTAPPEVEHADTEVDTGADTNADTHDGTAADTPAVPDTPTGSEMAGGAAGTSAPEPISFGAPAAGSTGSGSIAASTNGGVGDSGPSSADADGLAATPGATLAELAVSSIHANAKQPRQVFDEDALAELTYSIREFGVLQPVVVRPDAAKPGTFELVMGERRLRAAIAAGLDLIPAIVRTTADDAMLRDALLENIHRAQLNPLEEAAAYQQLLEEFGATHDELARRIGRSRPQVSNTVRLLNLPLAVQRRVAAGVLSAGHARALLSLEDRDQQDELASRIVAEGLSVRATEELVSLARQGGAVGPPARRTVGPRITAPGVTALAGDLSDAFETRVKVDIGRRKGRITIEFGSIDDLERIVEVMAPKVAATRRRQPNEP